MKSRSKSYNDWIIVVDNLRIGGIQRIALDEAYALSASGLTITFVVLEEENSYDDIRAVDGTFFEKYNFRVIFLPKNNFEKILIICGLLRNQNMARVVSHSAKGIALFQLSRIIARKRIKIIGFIHQLITLSHLKQRIKRVLFFSLANELHASSNQFILELEELKRESAWIRVVLKKEIIFDRMGVYLPRIENRQASVANRVKIEKSNLIFMSRVVDWKGFDRFIQLGRILGDKYQYWVFTSPIYGNDRFIAEKCQSIGATIMLGKSIMDLPVAGPVVHLYPTDYGSRVRFPQSIGMNVLECLAMSIPSIISFDDFSSWPEFAKSPHVVVTDWTPLDVEEKVTSLINDVNHFEMKDFEKIERTISIERHVQHLRLSFE